MKNILKNTTIEPTIFIFNVSAVVTNFLFLNLFFHRACRDNTTSEPDFNTSCDNERRGQLFTATINSWRYSAGMILMIIFTIISSSWSDASGGRRRPLIFIPLVGQIIISLIGFLYSYFWTWPIMPGVILETIIHGASGSRFSLMYTAQIYLSDITNNKNRIFRMSVLAFVQIISVPIGNSISGYMLYWFGLSLSFILCTIYTIAGFIIGFICIKDASRTVEQIPFWKSINPNRMINDCVGIIIKKRNYNKRTVLWLLLIVDALALFPVIGESTTFFIYIKYRFKWNEKVYGVFVAYKIIILGIGTLCSAFFLSKCLKLHDGIISIISTTSSLIGAIWYIFADKNWEMYFGAFLEFFRGSSMPVLSAYLITCLDKHETGSLMSIRCLLNIITPMCFPVYNTVYKLTLDTFPSCFFLINVVIYTFSTVLIGLAYHIDRKTHIPCQQDSILE